MFDFFREQWGWDKDRFVEGKFDNCNGAFSTWIHAPENDGRFYSSRVMERWHTCAMKKECICPAGSSRSNHRQDQAALTLVLAMEGYHCQGGWVHPHGLHLEGHGSDDTIRRIAPHLAAILEEGETIK
uniref:Uncharacterized protein n=1 Tax=Rhizochromulina marina TaxID=1034831 RepID=A0A7S2SWB4_9STRA